MKDIKGFEGFYAITKDGRIWSYPRIILQKRKSCVAQRKWKGGWLKINTTKRGDWYYSIALQKNGRLKRKGFKVHRLVAQAFIPNPKNFKEINHKNGVKTDNRVENLEWCNRQENIDHSWKIRPFRNHRPKRKLTTKQVKEIIEKYSCGNTTHRKLGDEYNVSFATIGQIIRHKSYLN